MQHKLHEASNKTFLTDVHNEHSAVCWNVCSSYYENNETGKESDADVDATLRIQDCTRSISIEFDAYGSQVNEEHKEKRLEKVQRLIDELVQFKKELEEGYGKAIENNSKDSGE